MALLTELGAANSEEDVKDSYIKALGLKKYTKGLIDIQTEEIWFEAKDAATPPILIPLARDWMTRSSRSRPSSFTA